MENTKIIKHNDPKNILWQLFRLWADEENIPFETDRRMVLYLKQYRENWKEE